MDDEQKINEFNRATEVFSIGFKQDFVTFLRLLHEKKIPLDDAVKSIVLTVKKTARGIIATQQFSNDWNRIALKCDKCGKIMRLLSVNTHPGDQVGGKFKSQWFCPDIMNCGHYILSRKSLPEIIKKRRRKANYKP